MDRKIQHYVVIHNDLYITSTVLSGMVSVTPVDLTQIVNNSKMPVKEEIKSY